MDLARHVHNGLAREIGRVLHHALAHRLVIHKQDGLQFGEGPVSTAQVDLNSFCGQSTPCLNEYAVMVLFPWLAFPMSDTHPVPNHAASQSQGA